MNTRISIVMDALRTMYPSASNPYWRALPIRRMTRLFLGTFLLASVPGFGVNVSMLYRPALLHGFFWPLLTALVPTCLLLVRLRRPRWVVFTYLFAIALFWLAARIQSYFPSLPESLNPRTALWFNAMGIWIGVGLGSRLMMSFLTTEGAASVRMQTELALAHGIQSTLVPPISLNTPRFEVYGISVPSTEMGGDLVDAVANSGHLVAYVADVSGHGLPAGQLMGMLKTAMRLSLELRQPPVASLQNADRVLPSLKEPEMYATLALLHFDDSIEAEYSVAGHVPILHYRKSAGDIVRLAMRQFPVGLFPGTPYASARTKYAPGDLFVILTDGITEVANEQEEELGLARVETLIAAHATQALPHIWHAIHNAATAHGPRHDDQSALLIRAL